jgi:predicted RNA-binding Zn ribbon-like protein
MADTVNSQFNSYTASGWYKGQVLREGDRPGRKGSPHGHARPTAGSSRDRAGRSDIPWTFHIGYGALCLDFANTVSWRGGAEAADRLPTYRELVRFIVQSGLLSDVEARRLKREAARRPDTAARTLRRAVELREALWRTFSGLAAGRSPRSADLATLNALLPAALAHLRVSRAGGRFGWRWDANARSLDRLLWPVARDAAVFLTSSDFSRLRTCANPQCRWVFLDTTKSGTRRWCSMAVCGNRDKVRRFRQRRRSA